MIYSNYHLPSIALGVVIGLATTHVINSPATTQAINKICHVAKSVYDALTFENVAIFTLTCMGISLAASFVIPAIQDIFNQIIHFGSTHDRFEEFRLP